MFPVTWRFVAGLAIGGAAAMLWSSRRAAEAPRLDDHPQHSSRYREDVDGRGEDNALIDGAVEDTFPASDPPAFMQSVITRPPLREQRHAESEDEIVEAHPS